MKIIKSRIILSNPVIVATILMLVFAVIVPFTSCSPYNAYLRKQAENHKTRTIQFWGQQWREKPFTGRISEVPVELVEKIRIENRLNGIPEKPSPEAPSTEFFDSARQSFLLLPEVIRRLANERIIGVFIVKDLGGTGYTEAVLDEEGREKYAVIVLDRNVLLERTANVWATWKENSFFKSDVSRGFNLRVVIESPENDTVVNAISFILLHEMGHALGMASGVHPSWNDKAIVSDAYPFTKLSWRMSGDQVVSLFDDKIPQRLSFKAYSFENSELRIDQSLGIYTNMNSYTNFPTIYAATNIWEDFAESFVTYLHVVRESKPYEIHLTAKGMPESVFKSCWNGNLCERKKEFMKEWFDNPKKRFMGEVP